MTRITTSTRTTQYQQSPSCVALTLYLAILAPSGRRSMRSLLQQVALLNEWSGSLEQMPWLTLRYEQVSTVRTELRQANKSPNTINTTLAAIRGVLKSGFLSGHFPALEWQRIQVIDRIPGKSLPAGRHLRTTEIMSTFRPLHCMTDGISKHSGNRWRTFAFDCKSCRKTCVKTPSVK
ncbi:hypothetical protein [Methylobacter svalbardensis]|uniref:hypothetical protein n=1 Tax=Methylobacter svalbardensis TaxID=3080016 RepID=UPI0030EC8F89